LCGNGPIDVEHEVRVVDPETGRDSEPGVVGELWLRGPAVCTGYWQRPDETAAVFEARVEPSGDGPYLRSGDFGFVHDGEVFVCGRMKHLIIIRGRNIYPQDVELAVERSHAAVRPGCSIAFAHDTPAGEELIVLAEVAGTPDEDEVVLAVKNAVLTEFEIRPADVMLLPPRGVPKTSSGKLARNAARDLWLRGGPDPDQNDVGLSGR
jgi:acyl-CoA synthetase (AMP-forming)/AMP-acid ligase II